MQKRQFIEIIKKKVKEHEKEMAGCQINLDAQTMSLTADSKPDITKAAKLAVLKDKMMFHKACKMTLEDLLEEVNNG